MSQSIDSKEVAFAIPTSESSRFHRKRKTNVRACDACAIRKVKCSLNRPCTHCVTNNLKCTQLRERKKSGPKNLHRKTLDSINSLSEVIDPGKKINKNSNTSTNTSSNNTDEEIDHHENDNIKSYLLTPANLIENLNLIIEEPIIFELIKPLTVQSLLINCQKLTEFLTTNFPGLQGEISLVNFHNNSIFLSNLLIILTLNLIIVEILIKLKKQGFKDFIKYPRKFILFRNFKNFKNLCHFKCIEIFTLVEKNFIVPPVIPMNNLKNLDNINLNQINQYQIYYNLSLSCLNLCNYYHTLNLTNTLNSVENLKHNQKNGDSTIDTNYGNEAQEHQKIINLNRAITYYQLINIKSNDPSIIIKLYELFEILFTYERYYFIFSSNNYCLSLVRNNDLSIQLNSTKINKKKSINIDNKFNSNVLYDVLNVLNEFDELRGNLFERLVKFTNFNVSFKVPDTDSSVNSSYFTIKSQLSKISNQDNILEVIKQILLFKLLLIEPIPKFDAIIEFTNIIKTLNLNLLNESDLFKLQISNYQSIPHLLHLLKVLLEFDDRSLQLNDLLVEFSDNLIKHFPFFNNINKLIRAHRILNDWFLNLNSKRSKFKKLENNDCNNNNTNQVSSDQVQSSSTLSTIAEPSYLALLNDIDQDLDGNLNSNQIHDLPQELRTEVVGSDFISPLKSQQPILRHSITSSTDSINENTSVNVVDLSKNKIPFEPLPENLSTSNQIPMGPPLSIDNSISFDGHGYYPNKSTLNNSSTQQQQQEQQQAQELEQMTMSESTKNLYNLFHQISEEFSNNNHNINNLFQLNPQFLGNKDEEKH